MKKVFQKAKLQEILSGYLFVFPALVTLGIFLILPILYLVFLSFNKVRILGELSYRFVAWKNFTRILEDERVWIALTNTFEYVIIVVPIQTILALLLAIILNAKLLGKNWFRVIFFCQL